MILTGRRKQAFIESRGLDSQKHLSSNIVRAKSGQQILWLQGFRENLKFVSTLAIIFKHGSGRFSA